MLSLELKQTIRSVYQRLNKKNTHFRSRREQNYMVAEIAKTFAGTYNAQRKICVIEAGTGTGKSLAYLLGSIPFALAEGKKVCISTATIALQEQLARQELPFLETHIDEDFSFGIAKGRQRYVCLAKLENMLDETQNASATWTHPPDKAQRKQLKQLQKAYRDGEWDGEFDNLPEPLTESLWQQIASDKHSCQRQLDGHRDCPFHQSRDAMQNWDIIITNHHLLLADLELGGGVILPEPDSMFYVIDEAHHLPHTVRNFSSARSSLNSTAQWLLKLPSPFTAIEKKVKTDSMSKTIARSQELIHRVAEDLQQVSQFLTSNEAFFANEEKRYRAPHGVIPEPLQELSGQLKTSTQKLLQQVTNIQQQFNEAVKDGFVKRIEAETLQIQLGIALQRLENLTALWQMMAKKDAEQGAPYARWFDATSQEKTTDYIAQASPIEVGFLLENLLWSKACGVVLCSATLRALNSFELFQKQAGLASDDGTQYIALPSPFDYQKNASLYLPKMTYDPSQPQFTQELIEKLPTLINDGTATLVLFSSYKQMQAVADRVRISVKTPIFVQGEEPRHVILTKHKKRRQQDKHSVIFGTSSFSEGLDLPGEQLTNLIITKLPFAVPTSPVEQAQSEYIKQQGENPFAQLTLPDASRKLIQSCGRLLRHEQDYGRITLMDKRLQTRYYGAALLNALPPYQRITD